MSPHYFSSDILDLIKHNEYDIIAFTSPSQVRNFMGLLNNNYSKKLKFACIGKTTEKEVLKYNITPWWFQKKPMD